MRIDPSYPHVAPIFLIYSPAAIPPSTDVETLFETNFGLSCSKPVTSEAMEVEGLVVPGAYNNRCSVPSVRISGLVIRNQKSKSIPSALAPYAITIEKSILRSRLVCFVATSAKLLEPKKY